MGRKRKNADPLRPLPQGLYLHGRKYRAEDQVGYKYFGDDYEEACKAYRAWRGNGPASYLQSTEWLIEWYLIEVASTRLRPRTLRDYRHDKIALVKGLGHIPYRALQAKHISEFKTIRAKSNPTHVNRELAVLSSTFTAALEAGKVESNPVKLVRRMPERRRLRLVSHDEYLVVHEKASRSVRIAMALALRTLQRPDDVLGYGPRHLERDPDGTRVLAIVQSKTRATVRIRVEGELAQLIDAHMQAGVVRPTFVYTERESFSTKDKKPKPKGSRYTVDGFGAVFRECCIAAGVSDFGLRDLRAKGATDMDKVGVDRRHIQALLGHNSLSMTEVYLKHLAPMVVSPNQVPVIASTKG